MWKLSIEDDQGNKTVVNLVRDDYTVGRSEDNTVRLTERNISRRHAKLMRNGTGWLVEDLASYNGCFVNGVRVAEPQRLEHGDLVQLGDYRLEIMDEQISQGAFKTTAQAVPKSHALLSQPDRLVMLAGPTPGAEFPLSAQRVVIGRGEECDIAINHASVSRVHAEIHALGDGRYEIVDRESANGLRVNGVDLKRSLIDARDTIELGDVVLKFIPAGQIFHPSAEASQPIAALNIAAFDRHTPAPGVGVERRAPQGIPGVFKVFVALAFVGVLVMIGVVAISSKNREAEANPQVSDGASQILQEALQLAQDGEVERAHQKVTNELPADSNARQSPEFRDIESRWASMLFDLAKAETDPARKRALLDRIAKSTTVDQASRTRADNELAALDKGTSIEELPNAPAPEPTVAGGTPKDGPTEPKQNEIVRKDPYAEAIKKKTAAATAPKTAKETTEPAPPKETDLGDRVQLTRQKNALKGKVASGNATDADRRMLRALCRQLGDMSCVQ